MEYESDKCESFIEDYLPIIQPLKNAPTALLELGIFKGGSLKFWSDFFEHPDTKIIGIDVVLPDTNFPENVFVYQCDQRDQKRLEQIAQEHGPFQVIIDDASHHKEETKIAFDCLFEHVAIGGYYVIEDWAVGYWRDQPLYAGMVELITQLIEKAPELKVDELRIILAPAKSLAFFRRGESGWKS